MSTPLSPSNPSFLSMGATSQFFHPGSSSSTWTSKTGVFFCVLPYPLPLLAPFIFSGPSHPAHSCHRHESDLNSSSLSFTAPGCLHGDVLPGSQIPNAQSSSFLPNPPPFSCSLFLNNTRTHKPTLWVSSTRDLLSLNLHNLVCHQALSLPPY